MFTDINLFRQEQQKFSDEINEVNMSTEFDGVPEKKDAKIKEINSKFKDAIRKFLPTCLNIVNTRFGCKYSLYKVGKDYDSSFKVIETNVKKTKDEILQEFNSFKSLPVYISLDENAKSELDLVFEILTTYVEDDNIDPRKALNLADAKPIASSIITNVPRMSEESLNSIADDNSVVNYNPYSGQPVSFAEEPNSLEKMESVSTSFEEKNDLFAEPQSNNNNSTNLNETNDAQDNTSFSMNIFY